MVLLRCIDASASRRAFRRLGTEDLGGGAHFVPRQSPPRRKMHVKTDDPSSLRRLGRSISRVGRRILSYSFSVLRNLGPLVKERFESLFLQEVVTRYERFIARRVFLRPFKFAFCFCNI